VRDLTQLRVHVIAAADSAAAGAVKEHAPAIPLVLLGANDPVGTGLVASLARPGGNITGLSNQLGELEGKVRQPLSYSPDSAAIFRRGADYIDKILRGARPAELPIEQPTKFELVRQDGESDRPRDPRGAAGPGPGEGLRAPRLAAAGQTLGGDDLLQKGVLAGDLAVPQLEEVAAPHLDAPPAARGEHVLSHRVRYILWPYVGWLAGGGHGEPIHGTSAASDGSCHRGGAEPAA
jgi:hypothetical protein